VSDCPDKEFATPQVKISGGYTLAYLKSSFNALLKSSIIPFIGTKMDVAVTFAKDEDAARQHIQKLSDEWKFQDDGHVGTNHKARRMAQTLLAQYGIT
jgi:hypothetical protein